LVSAFECAVDQAVNGDHLANLVERPNDSPDRSETIDHASSGGASRIIEGEISAKLSLVLPPFL
jgi:hypothetical protein